MYVTMPADYTASPAVSLGFRETSPHAETRLSAGTHLYFEGDRVHWLYQVVTGVVRLTRLLADGRRQVIAFGYPGDIVGFPSNGDHHTDCEALTETSLQPYRRSCLENGEGDPIVHKALLQAALREISGMQDHFMMLGRKSATEKVASFLSVLVDRVGQDLGDYKQFKLPMLRSDIADFLGLTTETVCRALTQLRKKKIIEIESIHTVVVLRPTALLGLSRGEGD
jgi:CRP/FNR family transcriptional regulator